MSTLYDAEVTVFGLTIELDIEVDITTDPGVHRTANGDGCPPTVEVNGFEIDEDFALAQLMVAYAQCDVVSRPFGITFGQEAEIRKAIAEAVLRVVEAAEIPDEEEDSE